MKKTIFTMFVLAVFAGSAFAAPDEMTFSKNGKKEPVAFNHKAHAAAVKGCTKCHATEKGGKIEGFGKEWAHKNCKACHTESKIPNTCKDCHKK